MKQLKQLEKQRKDLMAKLKQQEKKVQFGSTKLSRVSILFHNRLTILSVQNVLKRLHCCRDIVRNKLRMIGGYTRNRKRIE